MTTSPESTFSKPRRIGADGPVVAPDPAARESHPVHPQRVPRASRRIDSADQFDRKALMTTLHIANSRTADMVGGDLLLQTDVEWRIASGHAQRVAWFARDGDVLVLRWAPEDVYLDYVTELTGTRRSSLRLVVPPPGAVGTDILSPDRLEHEGFRE